MKTTFVASVLAATTFAYYQEHSYIFMDANNKKYESGITTLVPAAGYVMTADF
jgi:hypothetical protein